jgi:hypothetical protein
MSAVLPLSWGGVKPFAERDAPTRSFSPTYILPRRRLALWALIFRFFTCLKMATPAANQKNPRPANRPNPRTASGATQRAARPARKESARVGARPFQMPFETKNMTIILIGVATVALGYLIMGMSPTMSFAAITLAPFILVLGYCIIIPYGIMYGARHYNKTKRDNAAAEATGSTSAIS